MRLLARTTRSITPTEAGWRLLRPLAPPAGLDDIAELVLPELQRRGPFHTEQEGTTPRESSHLARPARVPAQDTGSSLSPFTSSITV